MSCSTDIDASGGSSSAARGDATAQTEPSRASDRNLNSPGRSQPTSANRALDIWRQREAADCLGFGPDGFPPRSDGLIRRPEHAGFVDDALDGDDRVG